MISLKYNIIGLLLINVSNYLNCRKFSIVGVNSLRSRSKMVPSRPVKYLNFIIQQCFRKYIVKKLKLG